MAVARTQGFDPAAWGVWILLAVAVAGATATIPGFASAENVGNIVRQSAALAVLAIGQTFVIVAGLIDLSVGMAAGLIAVLACGILMGDGALTLPVAAGALVLGAAIGLANGVLHRYLRVHPLILTFGMLSILQGVIFVITDRSLGRASPELVALANDDVAGLPLAGLVVAAVALLAQAILGRTRFGYHLMAVGGSAESARRAGIAVSRIQIVAFVLSGLSAGAAGLLLAGRLGTGYPLAGSGMELDAIVAVVLGGTSLAGGRGSILRTIGGVLVLGIASNALNALEVSPYVQMLVKGLIVVAAILANQPRRSAT